MYHLDSLLLLAGTILAPPPAFDIRGEWASKCMGKMQCEIMRGQGEGQGQRAHCC